jgi:zinc transport system permease protein
MPEFLSYTFMQYALIAGIAVAVVAPLLGIFITVRRQSLIADTLSHASLAGIAIGVALNIDPLLTAALAAVFGALIIEGLRSRTSAGGESTLALVLSGSLALSVVVMSAVGSFNASILSYLFGGITTVSESEVISILIASVLVTIFIIFAFERLFLLSFDEEIASSQGLKTTFLNLSLALSTAIVVAVGMRVVGVLLIGALMVVPVLAAMQLGRGFKATTLAAMFISVLSVILGIITSYYLDLATGGTIVLFAVSAFLATSVVKAFRQS